MPLAVISYHFYCRDINKKISTLPQCSVEIFFKTCQVFEDLTRLKFYLLLRQILQEW